MNKYSTISHFEPSLQSKYKIKQSGTIPIQIRTEMVDQNNHPYDRLDIIRKKYTSKEKDRNANNNNNSLRREEVSREKDSRRQALKQKLNERARSHLNISEYSMYNNQCNYQSGKKQASVMLDDMKQRHERSKEKVCERVENIKKINDKIKNILNRFEIGIQGNGKSSIGKRETVTEQRRDINSSFKTKKLQLLEQQFKSRQFNGVSSMQYNIPYRQQQFAQKQQPLVHLTQFSQQPKQHVFPFKHINTTTVNVSQNESLNMTIDESFVLQKYNPSQTKLDSNQLLDLVSRLCNQIQYDEQFRTSKYFFLLSLQEDKYQKLQKQFQNKNVKYSLDELTELMRFAEEEYDPFMYQTAHEDYGKYADSFTRANEHWKQNLTGKYDYENLIKSGIEERLTVESKSQGLVVADFVRFVNLTSGNLYKNRDLIIIMRRLGEDHISIEQVYKTFCKNYK